jgi:hypothetical protein
MPSKWRTPQHHPPAARRPHLAPDHGYNHHHGRVAPPPPPNDQVAEVQATAPLLRAHVGCHRHPNGGVIQASHSLCPRGWQRHRHPRRLSSTAAMATGMPVLPRPSEQGRWPAAVPSGTPGPTVWCHLSHTAARHPLRLCATHTHLRRGPSSSTAALRSSSAPTAPVAESARARVAAASASCCDSAASLAHPSASSTGAHGSSRTGPPAVMGVCRNRTQRTHTPGAEPVGYRPPVVVRHWLAGGAMRRNTTHQQ